MVWQLTGIVNPLERWIGMVPECMLISLILHYVLAEVKMYMNLYVKLLHLLWKSTLKFTVPTTIYV